jgi:hypothetical protein
VYPCPSSTYQNTTGRAECFDCTLVTPLEGCLPAGKPTADACDPEKGWTTRPEPCDQCVLLPKDRSLQSNTVDSCTFRGIVPGRMVKDAQGNCQTCFQCSGVNFNRSANAPFCCAVSESDCVPIYYNSEAATNYNCHADTSSPTEKNLARRKNGMVCEGLEEANLVRGFMPWKVGFSRPLPPDSWRQIPGDEQMWLVPYYKRCDKAPSPPYHWRQTSDTLHRLTWADVPRIDCQSLYAGAQECTAGNVAVLFTDDTDVIPRLKACEPCRSNGTSVGGLTTQCPTFAAFGQIWPYLRLASA